MKGKAVAAVLGGSLLILSSAAHAFLGWPAISAALKETNATAELTTDLTIGWLFGSTAMLAFGLIVLVFGVRLLRGGIADRCPAMVIAGCYFCFGLAAFVWTHHNPHFIGFMVIGAIVAIAASGVARQEQGQVD